MSKGIYGDTKYVFSEKQVNITDRDGEKVEIRHNEGTVFIEADYEPAGQIVGTNAVDLIEAIAKISGLVVAFPEPLGEEWVKIGQTSEGGLDMVAHTDWVKDVLPPEPELWTNVRYRAARAVEVTPELVLALRDGPPRPELGALSPWFSETTGEPGGVKYFDPQTYNDQQVGMGLHVVLRPGQPPQVLGKNEFEDLYEEAA